MKIGIVNDSPMAVEALRRGRAAARCTRSSGSRATAPRRSSVCAGDTPDLVLMDLDHAGHGRRGGHAPHHGQYACAILIVTATSARTPRACSRRWAMARSTRSTRRARLGDPRRRRAASEEDRHDRRSSSARSDSPGADRSATPASSCAASAWSRSARPPAGRRRSRVLGGCRRTFPRRSSSSSTSTSSSRGHGRLARTAFAVCRCAWPREGDRPEAGHGVARRHERSPAFKSSDAARLHRRAARGDLSAIGRRVLRSVCAHWRGEAIGVLLTGMGRDGARGSQGAARPRATTPSRRTRRTSAVYGMPKAAAALGAAVDVLPLNRIAPRLLDAVMYQRFAEEDVNGVEPSGHTWPTAAPDVRHGPARRRPDRWSARRCAARSRTSRTSTFTTAPIRARRSRPPSASAADRHPAGPRHARRRRADAGARVPRARRHAQHPVIVLSTRGRAARPSAMPSRLAPTTISSSCPTGSSCSPGSAITRRPISAASSATRPTARCDESQQKLLEANFELQRLMNMDGLTALNNRRRFDEYAASRMAPGHSRARRASRCCWPTSTTSSATTIPTGISRATRCSNVSPTAFVRAARVRPIFLRASEGRSSRWCFRERRRTARCTWPSESAVPFAI